MKSRFKIAKLVTVCAFLIGCEQNQEVDLTNATPLEFQVLTAEVIVIGKVLNEESPVDVDGHRYPGSTIQAFEFLKGSIESQDIGVSYIATASASLQFPMSEHHLESVETGETAILFLSPRNSRMVPRVEYQDIGNDVPVHTQLVLPIEWGDAVRQAIDSAQQSGRR